MELINFIFQSFWHFLGSFIILGLIAETIVRLTRGYPPCDEDELEKKELDDE